MADSAGPLGLDVGRLVTDIDLDAGMSLALPALRASLQESLADDSVHAVVAALLPARGLTVESLAGVLAECAAEAGKPVVAAFTGILDPSVQVEGMVGGAGKPVLPCYSNAGAAVAAWRRSSVTRSGATVTKGFSWSPTAAMSTAPGKR